MGNGIKILIANENAEMRKNCREALSRAGYTSIDEVTNGADALQMIERVHPDAVIADVWLSRLDGITLIRQALSRSYLGKIIPADRSGEFYGLMDIFGKGASFVGMLLVSLVSQFAAGVTVDVFGITLQNENLAVGSLIILFIIGFILFCKADKLNKERI